MKNKKVIFCIVLGIVGIILLAAIFSGIAVGLRIVSGMFDIFFDALLTVIVIAIIVAIVIFVINMFKKNENKKIRKNLKEMIADNYGINSERFVKIERIQTTDITNELVCILKGIRDCKFYAIFDKNFDIIVEARDFENGKVKEQIIIKDYNDFFSRFSPVK